MARIENTVFISYRRKDISWALAVYQYLTSRNFDVFFDYESIYSGDFEQVIISNIKARAHFVLILTPTALDRCSEPADWLRREIETAVDEKRNIIPLFFDGFDFGSPAVAEKLTGKIAAIKRYNGLEIPSGYFLEAMVRLSDRYLSVPLDAVIHPISTEVRKVVKDVQIAANNALIEKREHIRELVKPAEQKSTGSKQVDATGVFVYPTAVRAEPGQSKTNFRVYGFVFAVLLIVVAGIAGVRLYVNNMVNITATSTGMNQLAANTFPVIPSAISNGNTGTAESVTPMATDTAVAVEPTFTIAVSGPVPGSTMISPSDGETLIFIPPGTFTMGLTDDQVQQLRQLCTGDCEGLLQASSPAHEVQLTKGYWMYQTEVSNAQYKMCISARSCREPRSISSIGYDSYFGNSAFDNYPVVWVDWDRAVAYCSWAGGRLPTSAEWEYAARKDDKRLFPWGNDVPDGSQANVNGFLGRAISVNHFADYQSPFGLLNMTGNAWEWVSDWYSETYYHDNTDWVDPSGPEDGTFKVGRGGSWWVESALASIAIQDWEDPDDTGVGYNYDAVGFRCARDE